MRRSKKQPDYDPTELADLINTPAVGSGVGSHLLTSIEELKVATAVVSEQTPVVAKESATIVPGRKDFPAPVGQTEVTQQMAPIVTKDSTIVDTNQTPSVDTWPEETSELSTVVVSPANLLERLWISESGEIVPQSRVHRVSDVDDALSSGEQTLYHLLWGSQALREAAGSRSIQAGYDSLTKGTGFSRKTIQRTIDRLIAKHYIEIETPADIYRRTPTVYRVFEASVVLEHLTQLDCIHIAKIGPGVAFVAPLSSKS